MSNTNGEGGLMGLYQIIDSRMDDLYIELSTAPLGYKYDSLVGQQIALGWVLKRIDELVAKQLSKREKTDVDRTGPAR